MFSSPLSYHHYSSIFICAKKKTKKKLILAWSKAVAAALSALLDYSGSGLVAKVEPNSVAVSALDWNDENHSRIIRWLEVNVTR